MERILVAVMPSALPGSALRSEFDTFLFASIGADRNGMELSVLSGLAQSDLDPWQEAAKLAELPGKSAVERLASLIESLPGRAWAYPEAQAVATRLIGLLPHSIADNATSSHAYPRCDDEFSVLVDLRHAYVLRSGFPVYPRKPSIAADGASCGCDLR